MHNEKISVIVPAYNLAHWISGCLDSILAQTHENLEVIVVDDGSGDETFSVVSQYAEMDSRVKAIQQDNGGVTSARLRGIREASGEWIGFVDGDDFIEPQMYTRLLENAHSQGADISHCSYRRDYDDGRVEYHAGLEEKMDLSIRNNEDMLMNYYLFSEAQSSVYEAVCPYHYRMRADSASHRKLNAHRVYDPVRVREIILDCCDPELKTDARQALLRVLLYVYALITVEKDNDIGQFQHQIRQKLVLQKAYYCILSPRNQALARLIQYTPWLFRWVFCTYVALVLHGHYE